MPDDIVKELELVEVYVSIVYEPVVLGVAFDELKLDDVNNFNNTTPDVIRLDN